MWKLFGTDGVRGVVNRELTPELVFKLGKSAAEFVKSKKQKSPVFIVGTDTRISKDELAGAMAAGIHFAGGKAVFAGVIPTPGIAYLTRTSDIDAGVVISASHNSYEYNGIKFFDHSGFKLSDESENIIESMIYAERDEYPEYLYKDHSVIKTDTSLLQQYQDFLGSTVQEDLSGMQVVLDCANGAAYRIGPKVLENAGVKVLCLSDKPDGKNINDGCGSTSIGKLKNRINKGYYDCALAVDGDADRLLMLDELGNAVNGDQVLTILALYMKREGKLKKNTMVATVMSNIGLDMMAHKNGIDLVKTKVGDRYILEEMLRNGFGLGGEPSGHMIMLEKNTTGDGIITALQVLQIMKRTKQKLSDLTKEIEILPQVLRNAHVDNTKKALFDKDEVIRSKCMELEDELRGQGRVLVRSSGTEPLIRVMIEGRDAAYITEKAEKLVELIEGRMR
jgi:phosphoglucosamine mutase